jgi:methyl-accepting chemotaxis protein WspA
MKNLTIRRRIIASVAIVLALMMLMAAVAYTQLMAIERESRAIPTPGPADGNAGP